ncbi:hypothetical protein P9E76_18775 [Schinkia azotoformans]|uniref:Uncharacterized protein n=1 Tax=Schinkia azotoformans LMG 9581 TaxID=1131731 RepID=K6CG86_SCHAZ|nr:hypothetical protein [Schinkia azotoformans]EKN70145.1 hypothetical protein BAZO_01417 [Schinkia azotoformans LMG 9581]MEC1636980.1 hypothetical protein [Schinkia azotoformans]MEC1947054.1 hypothetical protein [Schinkia azotoformans]
MEKALQLSFEDLGSRFKTLIPVWILGTGANFGRLNPYARHLSFTTNEIQKHLPVSAQQILVELLIEKGELKSALRMLDLLNHRVITLLKEEKIHKDELVRNPKSTIYDNKSRWGKQLKDVEAQFEEESQKYRKLDEILCRIAVSPEHQNTYMQLTKRLTKTKNNHDRLAKLVIENVRLEFQIRNSHFLNVTGLFNANSYFFLPKIQQKLYVPYRANF